MQTANQDTITQPKVNQSEYAPEAIWNAITNLGLASVAWRLPNTRNVMIACTDKINLPLSAVTFKREFSGFVVSPFCNNNNQEAFLLPADMLYKAELQNSTITFKSEVLRAKLEPEFKKHQQILDAANLPERNKIIPETDALTDLREDYIELVAKAIGVMKSTKLKKVVCSRTKTVRFTYNLDVYKVFEKLSTAYPFACICLFSIPDVGIWITATPELLLSVNQDNILRTVALAGTQNMMDDTDVFNARWKDKEKNEQAMVHEYIKDCFDEVGINQVEIVGPRTVAAGNLMHLKTDFTAHLSGEETESLCVKMLDLLHPTSAVCGMPKLTAFNFLLENERSDRKFYTGYLGPVNIENQTALFVNLRCMEVLNDKAILYAGAGITIDSEPAYEWMETELKCNTLLNILGR